MTDGPGWLPPLVRFEAYEGDWGRYIEAVHAEFRRDWVESRPTIDGRRFGLKRHPLFRGKEATFWHITSEGSVESDRSPDLRRCERICWPRAMVDAVGTTRVRVWIQERRSERRIAIALEDYSYVVILADRGEYLLLWTAYCVEQEHTRSRLRREYDRSQKG